MKATDEEVLAAVDGEMCAEQAEKLRIIRSHMDGLELCKANLMSLILSTAEKYIPEVDLVSTVPGLTAYSAIAVIGELGVDMSVFPTSKHLCSWAGLAPQNDQSAGKAGERPVIRLRQTFLSFRQTGGRQHRHRTAQSPVSDRNARGGRSRDGR